MPPETLRDDLTGQGFGVEVVEEIREYIESTRRRRRTDVVPKDVP